MRTVRCFFWKRIFLFFVAVVVMNFVSVAASWADQQAVVDEPTLPEEVAATASTAAIEWLLSIDQGHYKQAAALYTVEEDRSDLVQKLKHIRGSLGAARSRTYLGPQLVAVSTDAVEHVLYVGYETEFGSKTRIELVKVLVWPPRDPVILEYTIRERIPTDPKNIWK